LPYSLLWYLQYWVAGPGLGEEDLTLEWLEKSLGRREPFMVRLNVDPSFDSLRSNPRFRTMLKKMNLE